MSDHQTPRARTLTDADMVALKAMMDAHSCRFHNISREDMDFIKDLLNIYKETRSEVIKWLVKGVIYGSLILVAVAAWIKYGGRQ